MHTLKTSLQVTLYINVKSLCVLNVSVHQRTALYVAAEEGQLDVVKYFVDRGFHMDINSTYIMGVSILCSG